MRTPRDAIRFPLRLRLRLFLHSFRPGLSASLTQIKQCKARVWLALPVVHFSKLFETIRTEKGRQKQGLAPREAQRPLFC